MSIEEPPKEGLIDTLSKLIKATIDSAIPGGAVATELLMGFIKMPYQKRSEQWQKKVTEALNQIQAKGINLDKLKDNEEFIDILLQAIPIGIKHHQAEKRQALKNAIIRSAQDDAPELSLKQTFLNCIDTFTIWHIKILILFSNPKKWFEDNRKELSVIDNVGSVRSILENAFPLLRKEQGFIDYAWTDLYNKGFLSSDKSVLQAHIKMTSQGYLVKRTTPFGDQFINFTSD